MKEFDIIDVFMPGEESKERMKIMYTALYNAIGQLGKNLEDQVDDYSISLEQFFPENWMPLMLPYGLTCSYNEEEQTLYLVLYWCDLKLEELKSLPLIFVNVSGDRMEAFDRDCAAYTLMIALINHLGLMYNVYKES